MDNDDKFSDIQSEVAAMYTAGNAVGLAGAQCSILLDVLRALGRIEQRLDALGEIASEAAHRSVG